nr:helix-turn-helix domain-containing protein [Flexivirga oryzae]
MHRARGNPPVLQADQLVRALRYVAAVHDLLAAVPHEEHELEATPPTGHALTVKQCAQALGIGTRAVRQRISRGQLPATRIGRDYLIDPHDIPTRRAS